MPTIALAPALARWLSPSGDGAGGTVRVDGTDLRSVLEALFALHPAMRGYVLDEAGTMRHHVVAFVDGVAVPHKAGLAVPLGEGSEVFLFQALSGG